MTAKITGTSARATVSWSLEIQIERGSVPDRPMPYSRTEAVYRPSRLRLTFSTTAESLTLAQLNLRHVRMTGLARRGVALSGIALYGPRLRKDGQPGEHIVTENFYRHRDGVPGWTLELADAALADLTGDSS